MADAIPMLVPSAIKRRAKGVLTVLAKSLRVPVHEPVEPSTLSEEQISHIARYFSRPKFFVIGYPRSGTTLLARLLGLHPQVHCNWQAHFFSEAHSLMSALVTQQSFAWAARRNNRWTQSADDMTVGLRVVCDYVMESQADKLGKRIVGDKSPDANWSANLPHLHRVYPDAFVVNIVRDGRDVALSRRVQQLIDRPQSLGIGGRRVRQRILSGGSEDSPGWMRIFGRRWLRREAARWSKEVVNTHRVGRQLFAERYLAVTFEELLRQPATVAKSIWELLGADIDQVRQKDINAEMDQNPAAEWHREVAPELTAGLPRGEAGGWRKVFLPREVKQFVQVADEGLRVWGYLPGVP